MLLDPFEEQFHQPARFVKRADRGCGGHREFVGEEHLRFASLGILESDATQVFRIALATDRASKRNGLIASDARTGSIGAE